MKATTKINSERRNDSRISINGEIKYKAGTDDNYETAVLDNMSQTGVLVWLDKDLSVGSQLELRVDSEDDNQKPITLIVEIVRIVPDKHDYKAGYGCTIEKKS